MGKGFARWEGFARGRMNLPLGWRFLVSPAGAGIALVCFFLPWGRFSCAGLHKSMSGAQLGGSFWSLFWVAFLLIVVGGVLVFLRREILAQALVLLCSLYALIFLVEKSIAFSRGVGTPLGHIHPQDVGISPRPGGIGTLLGFLLAAGGSLWLRPGSGPAGRSFGLWSGSGPAGGSIGLRPGAGPAGGSIGLRSGSGPAPAEAPCCVPDPPLTSSRK